MTYIGTFTATRDGFEGHLHTLTLDTRLALVPAEPSETENAPDYRIMGGDNDAAYEVGAGWKRVGDKAGDYIAVLIDDPAFARALLDMFVLQKAAYEVAYELSNRPAWVAIPLRGLISLIGNKEVDR